MNLRGAVAMLLVVAAFAGFADTVYFKDGRVIRGVVKKPNPNTVVIQWGTVWMAFPDGDIDHIERTNDQLPVAQESLEPEKPQERPLPEILEAAEAAVLAKEATESGLAPVGAFRMSAIPEEQRAEIRKGLEALGQSDTGKRRDAHEVLVDLNRRLPVFGYVEAIVSYARGAIVPELLRVLVDLEPRRAKDTVRRALLDPEAGVRRVAIELLAAFRRPDDLAEVTRGLVDPDVEVQIYTARVLGAAALKGATPALVKALKSGNTVLSAASSQALASIWSTTAAPVSFETEEEWRTYWIQNKAGVEGIVDPDALKPLVGPGAPVPPPAAPEAAPEAPESVPAPAENIESTLESAQPASEMP